MARLRRRLLLSKRFEWRHIWGANTTIEWTDASWSPWEGCQKVGPGCDHCYAESMNRWLRQGANWGPGAPRRVYSDDHWEKPLRWNDAAAKLGEYRKVFPSVCDPFDNAAPVGQRERFAQLIANTPHLVWMLLTKRIGNAAAMLADMFPRGCRTTYGPDREKNRRARTGWPFSR